MAKLKTKKSEKLQQKPTEQKTVQEPEEKKKKRRRGKGRGIRDLSAVSDDVFFKMPFGKKFMDIYKKEHTFIEGVFSRLPASMLVEEKPDDLVDIFLLDKNGLSSNENDNEKEETFLSRWLPEDGEKPTRTTDHEELKERLHAKIEAIRQAKLDQINPDKKKKKKKPKDKDSSESQNTKQAQFISKANPNANNKKGPSINGSASSAEANGTNLSEKTPLRKKSVVKSDGQVVYSKFDFISNDKHYAKKPNSKPSDILKSVEKREDKIARLESLGKKSEAVTIAENQKWISAIRRAQGYKVRDDPNLLKKTIKKQDKMKKASTKKWKERTEKVMKEKDAKQQKRKGNIQGRKDENKKKKLKFLRKKGRIA